jgi:competence protein ComEC
LFKSRYLYLMAWVCYWVCTQSGCPDTTVPQIYAGGQRVCSIDELEAFREVSNQIDREELWIAFVDVGQGDATWIRTPGTRDLDAKDILVDTGNCRIADGSCGFSSSVNDLYDSDGVGALITFMKENGWIEGSPIDFLVATHPDKDHYGGTWKVLEDYRVGAFVSSGISSDNKTYQTALSAVNAESGLNNLTPVTETGINPDERGQLSTDSWGRNIKVTLLSADRTASTDNNASVVLMINYLGTRILLTGDAETPLDRKLIEIDQASPGTIKANVLKAGHHAGQGTNSTELLDRIFGNNLSRKYAVVSAGLRDGLPNADTIARLENAVGDDRVYRTDRGDILAGKDRSNSAGDDHILLRVTQEGDLTICYAYSDDL